MNDNTRVKTILILAANPASTSRLRLDEEVREIEEGLRRANKREQFKLEQKWAVRQRDFYRAILDYQPQIVHFSGHSTGKDGIVLEDEVGQPALVKADVLASQFELFATKGVECVVLNACYSEEQAQAIRQYVDYVIGMNSTVGDKAAVAFAVAFYDAIAAGEAVEFAYKLGCSQMKNYIEEQTPVLLKKEILTVPKVAVMDIIPPNPYQGLAAFGEEDAAFFFGRETFVNSLVETVYKQPLVGIIGPSGSGKSSVVYAGLIPRLRKEGSWLIESFRPGNQPFYQLASALVHQLEPELSETGQLREAAGLAGDLQQGKVTLQQVIFRITERNHSKRLLLFVDQFEELYTQYPDKTEQERFADLVLAAIKQKSFTLVFTLRADFYGYLLSYRPWRDALEQFTPKLLSSMNRSELVAAIELPAQKLEVQLEPQLTQRILDDVGNEPGNLPLLEFALTRLWSLQQRRVLTHQAYEEIGGVKKALANHAEQIYQQLSQVEQLAAQPIFVQLVRPGEGTEDTRRVATRKEVGEQNWGLISYLAGYQARLVVTGRNEQSLEDTVEVVHESLIREWGTLREWMNTNRQFRVWQERLKVAMREWKSNDRDSGALLRGVSLSIAEEWLHKRSDEMTKEEQDFIQASTQQRDREKQERERIRKRTQNILICGFVGALSLAALTGWQWQRAERNTSMVAELLVSQPQKLFEQEYQLEALIASVNVLKKLQETGSDKKSYLKTLQELIFQIQELNRFPSRKDANVLQLSFSPDDGNVLASVHSDGALVLWDKNSPQQPPKPIDIRSKISSLSFSPKKDIIVVGSKDGSIFLLNKNGKNLRKIEKAHNQGIEIIKFNFNGDIFASLSFDKTVKIWNSKGEILYLIKDEKGLNYSLSLSSERSILALGKLRGRIEIWQKKSKLIELKESDNDIFDVSFSPDGNTIASASKDGILKLWEKTGNSWNKHYKALKDPKQIAPSAITSVSFSHDGNIIASGSEDGILRLWTKEGDFLTRFNCQSYINNVSFDPQDQIVGCANDKDLRLWSVRNFNFDKDSTVDFNTLNLIKYSCDHLRNYFLVNPEVLNKNKDLCPNK